MPLTSHHPSPATRGFRAHRPLAGGALLLLALLPGVLLSACAGDAAPDRAGAPDEALNTDPVPAEALAAIDTATLMRHIRVLAADSLLGRQPGTLGEERTAAYLEQEFRALGLAPGNPDGTYVQRVPLVGITVTNAPEETQKFMRVRVTAP